MYNDYLDYQDSIVNDIAIEFGFDAVDFGWNKTNKVTNEQLLNAQKKFNALSEKEQNELLKKRGF